jgi:hypothetical protein
MPSRRFLRAIGPGAPCVRVGQASVVVTSIGRISVWRMGERDSTTFEFVQLLPCRVGSVEFDVDADALGSGTLVLGGTEKTGEIEVGLELQAITVEREPIHGTGRLAPVNNEPDSSCRLVGNVAIHVRT